MILDEQALFSDKQKITATATSTNVVKVNGDIGKGEPVELLAQVVETFAGLTSLTLTVQTCDTENGSYEDLVSTGAILAADLVAGYKFPIKFLPVGNKHAYTHTYVYGGKFQKEWFLLRPHPRQRPLLRRGGRRRAARLCAAQGRDHAL